MGNPQHFSRDLPVRCLDLLDTLWPIVAKGAGGEKHGGPLTSTFLLTVATPMIVLPFERIEKHGTQDPRIPAYANDRNLDEDLTSRLQTGLGRPFQKLPIFQKQAWSCIETEQDFFNITDGLPDHHAEHLACPEAFECAAKMPASGILSCLRNSISHGGVMYLNEHGHTSHHEPVEMFAFVSAKMKGAGDDRHAVGLRILRVSEVKFAEFLRAWVGWLMGAGG